MKALQTIFLDESLPPCTSVMDACAQAASYVVGAEMDSRRCCGSS